MAQIHSTKPIAGACSVFDVARIIESAVRRGRARAGWELRMFVGRYPRVALPLLRARRRPGQFLTPVSRETEIVIEGFPRSANTFAVAAFHDAQLPRRVSIAHHAHIPAQLIEAARLRLPAVLIVRRPEEAVLSYIVRAPDLGVGQVMRSYVAFHEPLIPIRHSLVVASFEEVTSDLGSVIARVNSRFGTHFAGFTGTPEEMDRVRARIERGDLQTFGDAQGAGRGGGLPSKAREDLKDQIRQEYRQPALSALRGRAESAFDLLTDRRGQERPI